MQSTHLRLSDDIAEMRTAIKLNDRQAAANFSLHGPASIDQTPSQPGTAVATTATRGRHDAALLPAYSGRPSAAQHRWATISGNRDRPRRSWN